MYRKSIEMYRKAYDFSKKQDKFIKDNYLSTPLATMARKMGFLEGVIKRRMKKLGLVTPPEVIKKFREMNYIKKGNTPPNKGKKLAEYMTREQIDKLKPTQFKPGQKSVNELHNGAIVIRHSHKERGEKPNKWIRIKKNVWQQLQIYNWIKKHGPIPAGHVLRCVDGNTLNCKTSNWKLITRKEHALKNSGVYNLPDGLIATWIAGFKNDELREEVLKHPELIEVKRLHVQLNRKIKERTDAR